MESSARVKQYCWRKTLALILLAFAITSVLAFQWVAVSYAVPSTGSTTASQPKPSTKQSSSVKPDAAAQLFQQKCAGCHTIGGGVLVGPDLAVVQPWPRTEIAANIKRMQDRVGPLTDTQVQMLTGLLQDKAASTRIHASEQTALTETTVKLAPPSPSLGRQLFTGEIRLTNGGPACSSCHSVAGVGGTIGPDLTGAAARLGHTALVSDIQQANYKVMQAVFRRHPITPQEAVHLAGYLESIPAGGQTAPNVAGLVTTGGILAALLLFIVIPFFYRGRITGARARLVRMRR